MKNSSSNSSGKIIALWAASGILAVALLFARVVYPELKWLTAVLGLTVIGSISALIFENRKALRTRSMAHGLNSVTTAVLVIAIVGVVNFLASRYPLKKDLTRNQLYTLSDQTEKVFKGLKSPVKFAYFSKANAVEQQRTLFDNLKAMTTKLEVEYVDPDKEPARAKQVGIKKYGTLQMILGTREQRVEEVSEEKVTNAMIKLLKERAQLLCVITGHGEKNFSSQEAEGYDAVKKGLANQGYEVKDVNLVQETQVPDGCNAIAVIGPTKSFFEPEVKALTDYLSNGGRAVFALDMNIKGPVYAPELEKVINAWSVKTQHKLVIDPTSRMLGVDAAVPLVVGFSKEHPITKDFQAQCAFPFAQPLEIMSGIPAGIDIKWLGQSTPASWAETNLKELASGRVENNPDADKQGPLSLAISVEGKIKDSKATRNTRIVVFGSSAFATNNYSRFGGNLDFFLNSMSWLLEDESMISIRGKEDGPGRVELSQKQGQVIFLVTVFLIPVLVAVAGIVIWVIRRRL